MDKESLIKLIKEKTALLNKVGRELYMLNGEIRVLNTLLSEIKEKEKKEEKPQE